MNKIGFFLYFDILFKKKKNREGTFCPLYMYENHENAHLVRD